MVVKKGGKASSIKALGPRRDVMLFEKSELLPSVGIHSVDEADVRLESSPLLGLCSWMQRACTSLLAMSLHLPF